MIHLVWLLIKKCLLFFWSLLWGSGEYWILNSNRMLIRARFRWISMAGRSQGKDTTSPQGRFPSPPPTYFIWLSLFPFSSLRLSFFFKKKTIFALLSRRQTNIHCVSGTCCIALAVLGIPPTCQERRFHKLQKKLPANALLAINGSGELVFAIFVPAVGK